MLLNRVVLENGRLRRGDRGVQLDFRLWPNGLQHDVAGLDAKAAYFV